MTPERKLVLLVGDDWDFIEHAFEVLDAHRVLTVRKPDLAREVVAEGKVDAVLFDPGYANSTGIALAGELAEQSPGTAVAVCTDLASNRLLRDALHAGIADILDVPLDPDEVLRLLRTDPAPEVAIVIEPSEEADSVIPLRPVPPALAEVKTVPSAHAAFDDLADSETWSGERERPVA